MKMMKTEMEFVTFDAQDVIATSGGYTDVWYLTGTCEYPNGLKGYNDNPDAYLYISSGLPSQYIIGYQDVNKISNTWYTATAITNPISEISSIPGYENAEQHAIDIATVGDYNKVIEWLTEFTNGLGTRGIQ